MYPFVTLADWVPNDGAKQSDETFTERAGYIPIEEQVRIAILAGEQLEDYRRNAYPELKEPTVVFGDRIQNAERLKATGASIRKAHDEAAAMAATEAKQRNEAELEAEVARRMAAAASKASDGTSEPQQA